MSRIRSVKPEWMEDEGLLRAGTDARVLSVCLILLSDDYGRGRYIPEVMAAQCFPFESRETSRVFREAFEKLSAMGFAGVYEVRGQRYFQIFNWAKHQRVDKPGKPHVPEPLDDSRESSREPRETLASDPDPDPDLDPEREASRAPPKIDHWVDGLLEQTIRVGFQRRYEQAVQSIPNQSQVSKMSAAVSKWVAQTARLRNLPEDAIMRQLLDGFFASDSARDKGFPPSFLAANPLEYFEPRKKTGPDPKAQHSQLSKLEAELAQLKATRRALDKSDPEYDVKVYEADRDINAAQERRDSARRKLDATG